MHVRQSDIIVASPIGLRMIVKSKGDKGRETDFLTSIEMVCIDQVCAPRMCLVMHLTECVCACV
jgi:hypothetical protein